MKAKATRAVDLLFEAWWVDYVLIAALVALAWWRVPADSSFDLLGQLTLAERRSAYSDLLTVAALLAGFSTVAFTTYLGWKSESLKLLKARKSRRLSGLWIALMTAPWVSALVMWVVGIIDRGDVASPFAVRWIALGALAVLLMSVARSAWAFVELQGVEVTERTPVQASASQPNQIRRKSQRPVENGSGSNR